MSDVYRYDLSLPTNAKNFGMRLSENGCWVEHESYAALEAERDQLRARVEVLEKERDAIQFKLEGVQCEVGDAFANWRDFQKLATARHAKLASLRASIAALADEWEGCALANEQCGYPDEARIKAYRYCAATLRKLGEGNGRD